MRKGILSLSPLGRRKAMAKRKTSNMEKAEKAAVQKAEEVQQPSAPEHEKNYVQTVMVPKNRKASKMKAEGKQTKSKKTLRKK